MRGGEWASGYLAAHARPRRADAVHVEWRDQPGSDLVSGWQADRVQLSLNNTGHVRSLPEADDGRRRGTAAGDAAGQNRAAPSDWSLDGRFLLYRSLRSEDGH